MADSIEIRSAQSAEPPQKHGLLGADNAVKPRDGWLEQPGCTPVIESDVKRAGSQHGGDPADDGILLEVEEHQSRTNFAGGTRCERKLTNENVPEHISASNRK